MKYRAEIDGLRAIAVVPVMLFHAGFGLFSGGFIGVDVFFVISGYLITTLIINDLDASRFSLLHFYERRARRILPALFLVVLFCIPAAWFLLLPEDLTEFSRSLVAVATFSSNIFFWKESGYFSTAIELRPLVHTWSLAVEEQFYIFFPLLLMAVWRFGKRAAVWILIAGFIASLAVAQWAAYNKPEAGFYLLPTRGWELLVGTFAAFYLQRGPVRTSTRINNLMSALGLAAIIFSVLMFDKMTPFPSLYALVPTVGAVLIILFALQGTLVHWLLSLKGVVGVGLISYSAYLWHQPLYAFARQYTLGKPGVAVFLLLGLLSLVLAYLSWRFVEAPFRKRSSAGMSRTVIFGTALSGIVVMMSLGIGGHLERGFPGRYPAFQTVSQSLGDWGDHDECYLNGAQSDARIRACVNRQPFVYLIGDSHADAISASVRARMQAEGVNMVTWAYPGCLPIRGTLERPRNKQQACQKYKKQFARYFAEYPAPVILSARWRAYMYGTGFDNGEGGIEFSRNNTQSIVLGDPDGDLDRLIEKELIELRSLAPVIVIDQIPEAGWDVYRKVVSRSRWKGAYDEITTSYDVYRHANARVNALLDRVEPGIDVVRTAAIVCSDDTGRCRDTMNGLPLYRDDNHPAPILAHMIADEVWHKLESHVVRKSPADTGQAGLQPIDGFY
ncbi:acyltransferase family protein [Hyphomonas johnsonii]|uniref:Acyltransferase 3 n=1 Tax=Hyphomonas johnsonii MHS-2 TaxID=1280950 RepID=A0A059FUY7_9PROT|nr:acyltransferase family protein [Hyphomonas johnsonii]KCZ94417.1 acyltransferase 3 [Hyphomonas johnsonii MHS-2]